MSVSVTTHGPDLAEVIADKLPFQPEHSVLYEVAVGRLFLEVGTEGTLVEMANTLYSGRVNYRIFQDLVGSISGLAANSEGGDSDLTSEGGSFKTKGVAKKFEVKSFRDGSSGRGTKDLFHTGASCTAPANNYGPVITKMLSEGHYDAALALCREKGYDKNDFYIYTNTGKFKAGVPLRFVMLPTSRVLDLLSRKDPRLISRAAILDECVRTETVQL